jgi:hypothetical protein
MSRSEPFVLQSVRLLLTWVGAYLRVPAMFNSFFTAAPTAQPSADAAAAIAS